MDPRRKAMIIAVAALTVIGFMWSVSREMPAPDLDGKPNRKIEKQAAATRIEAWGIRVDCEDPGGRAVADTILRDALVKELSRRLGAPVRALHWQETSGELGLITVHATMHYDKYKGTGKDRHIRSRLFYRIDASVQIESANDDHDLDGFYTITSERDRPKSFTTGGSAEESVRLEAMAAEIVEQLG